ncbi:Protein ASM-1 [Aphelenchoides avenae]|nr:Protein ASM-1 [Aphelenchus avenae]
MPGHHVTVPGIVPLRHGAAPLPPRTAMRLDLDRLRYATQPIRLELDDPSAPKNAPPPDSSPILPHRSAFRWNTTLRQRDDADGQTKEIFRVLQISDIHFDAGYVPGSESSCSMPVCCTGRPGPEVQQPAGYWGTIAACDIPYWTIENMLAHINRTEQITYVILSGDYMSHRDWSYTRQDHMLVIRNLTDLLNRYFPTTPVFWAIGNHEGVPVNSFAPHFAPPQFRPEWLYKSVYAAGEKWLPPAAEKPMHYRGSYSVMITEKLKLISLNTGYCETTNFFLYINQTDPDDSLTWLTNELYTAEQLGQVAHIVAHIPPGDSECLEGWARNYYRIVNRFSETIRAQFFGHVHTDSFTVFYEDMNDFRSKPTSVLYSAPSVTTFADLNPAYRIYSIEGNYEGSSYDVIDFDTYFLNLTEATAEEAPRWDLLYQAKKEYELKDLTPKSWHRLSERIHADPATYSKFLRNYARRWNYKCDKQCRAELLCSLRRGHHNETALCPESSSFRSTVYPSLFRATVVEPSIVEPLTRDEFLQATKEAVWKRVAGWIGLGSS